MFDAAVPILHGQHHFGKPTPLGKKVNKSLTAAMNRRAALILRQADRFGSPIAFASSFDGQTDHRDSLEDLKLFATAWLGGLVFFGTFFS